MNYWVIAPIVIPLAAAGLLLAMARSSLPCKRAISAVACLVKAMAASLFYLVHSTLVTAGLFLLADITACQRDRGSELTPGSAVPPMT